MFAVSPLDADAHGRGGGDTKAEKSGEILQQVVAPSQS